MGEVVSEGCGAMPATQGRFAPVSVAVEGLGKSYGDVAILEDVSFSVEGGTSVAFVSPSGSGKSTLLSMLGLLLTPTAGQVRLNGELVTGLDDRRTSSLRLGTFGFVFQHTQLVGSLRAVENVAVPASFARGSAAEAEAAQRRAAALLEQLGLGERLVHNPYQLSIGPKRRVATRLSSLQTSLPTTWMPRARAAWPTCCSSMWGAAASCCSPPTTRRWPPAPTA